MEGYINKNIWIDLSNLPRNNKNQKIDWSKSIGTTLKFKYNEINGEIIIINNFPKECRVSIYIKDYTNECGYKIARDSLINCRLGSVLRPNAATSGPSIIKYFVNPNEAYLYSIHSGKQVWTQCPICGYKKMYRISDLSYYGFSCNRCGDGVSYPNKFMLCLLEQLQANFIPEISKAVQGFSWLKGYRYDFYVRCDDINIFIEMDGGFHYKDFYQTHEESIAIDNLKDSLSLEHNIKVIRIDCNYEHNNRFDFIKQNILKSELSVFFNLNMVNWELCNKQAASSYISIACEYWNNGIKSTTQIAKLMLINRLTVRRYLKIGASIGICDYTPEQGKNVNRQMRKEGTINRLGKCVAVYSKDKLVGVFRSGRDLERQSEAIFGFKILQSTVSQHCSGICNKIRRGDYTMEFITREENEQLLPQFSTIQN